MRLDRSESAPQQKTALHRNYISTYRKSVLCYHMLVVVVFFVCLCILFLFFVVFVVFCLFCFVGLGVVFVVALFACLIFDFDFFLLTCVRMLRFDFTCYS